MSSGYVLSYSQNGVRCPSFANHESAGQQGLGHTDSEASFIIDQGMFKTALLEQGVSFDGQGMSVDLVLVLDSMRRPITQSAKKF